MDISRVASERVHKTKTIVKDLSLEPGTEGSWNDNVRWDKHNKAIVIHATWVPAGPRGRVHHNYTIKLTLEDVTALIQLLGHAGSASDATLLRDHLQEHLPALVKLLACATGLVPTPMETA